MNYLYFTNSGYGSKRWGWFGSPAVKDPIFVFQVVGSSSRIYFYFLARVVDLRFFGKSIWRGWIDSRDFVNFQESILGEYLQPPNNRRKIFSEFWDLGGWDEGDDKMRIYFGGVGGWWYFLFIFYLVGYARDLDDGRWKIKRLFCASRWMVYFLLIS